MEQNGNRPERIAPTDVTLDAPGLQTLTEETSEQSGEAPVHIVEGSGPGLSCEMRSVLRRRLRTAAIVLFASFAVFIPWGLLGGYDLSIPGHQLLLAVHSTITLLLGLFAAAMCRSCPMSTTVLRWKELVVFGLPAILFTLMQIVETPLIAERHGMMPLPVTYWLLLIFTYSIFIPNTWRRAALVIGAMSAAPIIITTALWMFDPRCAAVINAYPTYYAETVLAMGIGFGTGVVGVYTIGTLRREAFKAKQLGQYNLRHLIGVGGMGEVYLAEHRLMKRPCAIKLIRPDKAGDPKILARFEREVKATAKLSHWNSIEIFDYGHADDGTFYYVMEFLPGMNLQELVTRFGPLPAERVIHLIAQTCDALSEAHAAHLVHRDIKPANIFAAQRGGLYDVAKLLDFGLVKPVSSMDNAHLTQEGSITGSPLYMSPEQTTGDAAPDARSDIYCLGAVAYYLLTGHAPFEYQQPIKVLLAHTNEAPKAPSDHIAHVPADLEAAIMRCLEKEPADRFQNVLEMRDALLACDDAGNWSRQQAAGWWQANEAEHQPAPQPATVS